MVNNQTALGDMHSRYTVYFLSAGNKDINQSGRIHGTCTNSDGRPRRSRTNVKLQNPFASYCDRDSPSLSSETDEIRGLHGLTLCLKVPEKM